MSEAPGTFLYSFLSLIWALPSCIVYMQFEILWDAICRIVDARKEQEESKAKGGGDEAEAVKMAVLLTSF